MMSRKNGSRWMHTIGVAFEEKVAVIWEQDVVV
jgi:hypothetical protein